MDEQFINKALIITGIIFLIFVVAYYGYLKPLRDDLRYLGAEWNTTNEFLDTYF